jgi:hypothetical protein
MNPEVKQLWKTYFCRANFWANTFTPEQYDVAIQMLTNLKLGPTFTKLGKPVFTKNGRHDVDTVVEYIENPEKCVENPYVYNAMHHTTDLDSGFIKTVIRKRTKDYDQIAKIIDDSAQELSKNVKKCYSFNDALAAVENILMP